MDLKGQTKPKVKLIGENENGFNLMGIASRALKKAGMKEQATEMTNKIMEQGNYDKALAIMMEYVDVD